MLSVELFARLLGGIGLFLLGMRLMTEGLRVAAGDALRRILARSTGTRLRGIASGLLVTSLVQSSSAVTVATIGFVNAGLLDLSQALAVVYGSNVGTTATAWLVAAVGLHFDVEAFALPLVGVGMAMRLIGRSGRSAPLGEALAGFGIFFLGIAVLRGGFEGLSSHIELANLVGAGPWQALLFVAVGFLLTVLMQSSSAALAVILTAAGGGVVPLASGAALVVGANLGTTTTAALAALGATPNAKRVAAGHVAFNGITGAVALVLLPIGILGIGWGRERLGLAGEPAAVLAAFHTLFNLLGVALVLPLTDRLLRFLEARFRSSEEDEATPRFLDRNVLATPSLALNAMVLELARAGDIARRLAHAALCGDERERREIAAGQRALAALVGAIGEYVQQLQRTSLPVELDALLPTSLRVTRYDSEVAELAGVLVAGRDVPPALEGDPLAAEIRGFVASADALVQAAGIDREGYDPAAVVEEMARIEARYHALKASLLDAGSRARLPVGELVEALDWLSNVRRLAEQSERGARFLASLTVPQGEGDPAPLA